jgi:pimeloyl-ACP methyl ester carboxylesterase
MPKFITNTISINYSIYGTGIPVILLHGAIVDFNYNYIQTGWIKSLSKNGFQVIGIDFRGYGESDKSSDPNFYGTTNFANDVINLIDHLNLENVGLIGYSMGTVIALDLLSNHPEYFSKSVLIATGDGLIGNPPFIFETLLPGLADLLSHETFPIHLPNHISAYWNFFKQIGLEKEAMIAFSLAKYRPLTPEKAAEIYTPTLIISGEKDLVLGTGQKVAQTLPNGLYLEIKEATHFTLATDRETHRSTIKFLTEDSKQSKWKT